MRRGSDDANWAPEAEARDVTRNPRGGSIMEQLGPFLGTIGSDDDNEIDEFEENFQPNQSKLGSSANIANFFAVSQTFRRWSRRAMDR